MTVEDLIKKLQTLPPKAEVYIFHPFLDDWEPLKPLGIDLDTRGDRVDIGG